MLSCGIKHLQLHISFLNRSWVYYFLRKFMGNFQRFTIFQFSNVHSIDFWIVNFFIHEWRADELFLANEIVVNIFEVVYSVKEQEDMFIGIYWIFNTYWVSVFRRKALCKTSCWQNSCP